MSRLVQIRLAAFQTRKSACWASGPDLRRCERLCDCCTSSAWLRSYLSYLRTYLVVAIHDSTSVRFCDADTWRSRSAIRWSTSRLA